MLQTGTDTILCITFVTDSHPTLSLKSTINFGQKGGTNAQSYLQEGMLQALAPLLFQVIKKQ